MKRKVFFLAIPLVIIVGFLVGCEDCFDNPPVITKYTIEAFAVDGTFTPSFLEGVRGFDAVLNLKPKDGYDPDSVFVNGIINELLRGKTTFNFSNIDGNIKVKAVCKINKWGVLMNGPWQTARWQNRLISEPTIWEMDKYPPDIAVDIVRFDAYRMKAVDSNGVLFKVGNKYN